MKIAPASVVRQFRRRESIQSRTQSWKPNVNTIMDTKKPKLGFGARFRKLTKKLSKDEDVKDPKAVAAAAGRKKYGKKKFQKIAAEGK